MSSISSSSGNDPVALLHSVFAEVTVQINVEQDLNKKRDVLMAFMAFGGKVCDACGVSTQEVESSDKILPVYVGSDAGAPVSSEVSVRSSVSVRRRRRGRRGSKSSSQVSADSQLTFTRGGEAAEGTCYTSLFSSDHVVDLGLDPTFSQLLELSPGVYASDDVLLSLRVTRVAAGTGLYHVEHSKSGPSALGVLAYLNSKAAKSNSRFEGLAWDPSIEGKVQLHERLGRGSLDLSREAVAMGLNEDVIARMLSVPDLLDLGVQYADFIAASHKVPSVVIVDSYAYRCELELMYAHLDVFSLEPLDDIRKRGVARPHDLRVDFRGLDEVSSVCVLKADRQTVDMAMAVVLSLAYEVTVVYVAQLDFFLQSGLVSVVWDTIDVAWAQNLKDPEFAVGCHNDSCVGLNVVKSFSLEGEDVWYVTKDVHARVMGYEYMAVVAKLGDLWAAAALGSYPLLGSLFDFWTANGNLGMFTNLDCRLMCVDPGGDLVGFIVGTLPDLLTWSEDDSRLRLVLSDVVWSQRDVQDYIDARQVRPDSD